MQQTTYIQEFASFLWRALHEEWDAKKEKAGNNVTNFKNNESEQVTCRFPSENKHSDSRSV